MFNQERMINQQQLVEYLINSKVLKDHLIVDAFYKVDRGDFIAIQYKDEAYLDHALPIGYGQTISQPTVVAFMLELLAPSPGEKILDIGAGSGWTTALIAECIGLKGQVYGVELIPELVAFAQQNLKKYGFTNAKILQAEAGVIGLSSVAPFDKILVSAAAESLPQGLLAQFTKRLVIPIKDSIWVIDKGRDGMIKQDEYIGFSFVPLIGN